LLPLSPYIHRVLFSAVSLSIKELLWISDLHNCEKCRWTFRIVTTKAEKVVMPGFDIGVNLPT
jgi:hypothetical protein